jgi:CRP-like cAMP-binding protein
LVPIFKNSRAAGSLLVPKTPPKPTPGFLRAFAAAPSRTYKKGAAIYARGAAPRGVFLVETGEVKVSIAEARGHTLFYIAGPGCVVGLGEVMAGRPYDATAEPVERATVSFLSREELFIYLREHRDICLQMVQSLSEDLHQIYEQYRRAGGRATRRRRTAAPEQSGKAAAGSAHKPELE